MKNFPFGHRRVLSRNAAADLNEICGFLHDPAFEEMGAVALMPDKALAIKTTGPSVIG